MTTVSASGAWINTTSLNEPEDIPEKPWKSFTIYVTSEYLQLVCHPLILFLGIFGNVMTIVIMRRVKSDDSTTTISIYFTAIAIADTIVLCTLTLDEWTQNQFSFEVRSIHEVVCKINTWLYTGSGTMSCWYLVCMTIHRAISIVWPHRVNLLCTRRIVFRLLGGITVFFAALYSHYIIGFERVFLANHGRYKCSIKPENVQYTYFLVNVFVYIELVVYCLVPFFFLVASNSVLVWKLTESVKVAGKHLPTHGGGGGGGGGTDQGQGHRKAAASSVTLTVVAVSVAFVALTLPASINFIVNFLAIHHGRMTGYKRAMTSFVNAVTRVLMHVNHAVNFYLYCLTGRRFREEFVNVMRCDGGGGRREKRGNRR
ncbi:uncharacterized protein LOC143276430 [Babylonia areolata]|uniref:uncharacterized protein LOC143276430 n=1 Tax=Babylonia areolata TaxID=304850 RepID=UPI003FD26E5E